MSDHTLREAAEDLRIDRLLQPAFFQVVIVVETDTQNFRRFRYRRQQADSVQVDCRRLSEAFADAQQVCTLCDKLGQRAWKSAFPPSESMPARAFIRANSGDSTCFKMNDAHNGAPLVRLRTTQFLEQ